METFKGTSINSGEKHGNCGRGKEVGAALCCAAFFMVSYFALSSSSFHEILLPEQNRTMLFGIDNDDANVVPYEEKLKAVFEKASMPDRTVIITTLNAAWAENNTMIDIFLESFQHGDGTQRLLQHLIIVCLDQKAYDRCLEIHPHCLKVKTGGVDFSGEQALLSHDYIKMIWRRIKFLETVLEMNYSFIFTDADVIWLRDPFPQLRHESKADMQIACDRFNGKPWDIRNKPNAGFTYVRANEKTLTFYKYWYSERRRSSKMADQEVFNAIKYEDTFKSIGMNLRFLDTQYFGGFCGIMFTDMTKAYTMHATCCKGLSAKLNDLRAILNGWKNWRQQRLETSPVSVKAKCHELVEGQYERIRLVFLPAQNKDHESEED
ncbi:hypothetical protein GOP47_0006307 [Adiantum capillus-veneris]|uniref:Glycosyltransferase n=1 Tax=Adiantum capillus-veneris TaxID=13818 RepID=A0A9D4V3B7_ADICA|nr:hypothetical protein GOP47_0006307 [Adiantum capillus-veneris]